MSQGKLNAIIIDDEEHCITTLKWNLEQYCSDVQVLAVARNGEEGFNLIKKYNPDLVLLDIEMPIMSGLEMLSKFETINFKVIFTTAHNEYAVKAIKLNASDYLLKPIDKDDLKMAIAKLSVSNNELNTKKIQNLRYNLSVSTHQQRITVGSMDEIQFFDLADITYFEANGNYTIFHFKNNEKCLSSRTLKDYEEILPPESFLRCHHSYIVNIKYIKKYYKGDGGEIELINGQKLEVSRRKKQDFIEWISM